MALRWMLCVAVLVGCLPSLHDSDRRCRLRASVPAFGAVITRRSPRGHSIVRTFGPLGHFGPRIRSSTAKPRLYASSSVLNVSDDCLTKVGLVSPRTISQTKPFGPDFRALTTSRSGGRTSPAGDEVMGRLAIFSVYSRRMITASVDLASAELSFCLGLQCFMRTHLADLYKYHSWTWKVKLCDRFTVEFIVVGVTRRRQLPDPNVDRSQYPITVEAKSCCDGWIFPNKTYCRVHIFYRSGVLKQNAIRIVWSNAARIWIDRHSPSPSLYNRRCHGIER